MEADEADIKAACDHFLDVDAVDAFLKDTAADIDKLKSETFEAEIITKKKTGDETESTKSMRFSRGNFVFSLCDIKLEKDAKALTEAMGIDIALTNTIPMFANEEGTPWLPKCNRLQIVRKDGKAFTTSADAFEETALWLLYHDDETGRKLESYYEDGEQKKRRFLVNKQAVTDEDVKKGGEKLEEAAGKAAEDTAEEKKEEKKTERILKAEQKLKEAEEEVKKATELEEAAEPPRYNAGVYPEPPVPSAAATASDATSLSLLSSAPHPYEQAQDLAKTGYIPGTMGDPSLGSVLGVNDASFWEYSLWNETVGPTWKKFYDWMWPESILSKLANVAGSSVMTITGTTTVVAGITTLINGVLGSVSVIIFSRWMESGLKKLWEDTLREAQSDSVLSFSLFLRRFSQKAAFAIHFVLSGLLIVFKQKYVVELLTSGIVWVFPAASATASTGVAAIAAPIIALAVYVTLRLLSIGGAKFMRTGVFASVSQRFANFLWKSNTWFEEFKEECDKEEDEFDERRMAILARVLHKHAPRFYKPTASQAYPTNAVDVFVAKLVRDAGKTNFVRALEGLCKLFHTVYFDHLRTDPETFTAHRILAVLYKEDGTPQENLKEFQVHRLELYFAFLWRYSKDDQKKQLISETPRGKAFFGNARYIDGPALRTARNKDDMIDKSLRTLLDKEEPQNKLWFRRPLEELTKDMIDQLDMFFVRTKRTLQQYGPKTTVLADTTVTLSSDIMTVEVFFGSRGCAVRAKIQGFQNDGWNPRRYSRIDRIATSNPPMFRAIDQLVNLLPALRDGKADDEQMLRAAKQFVKNCVRRLRDAFNSTFESRGALYYWIGHLKDDDYQYLHDHTSEEKRKLRHYEVLKAQELEFRRHQLDRPEFEAWKTAEDEFKRNQAKTAEDLHENIKQMHLNVEEMYIDVKKTMDNVSILFPTAQSQIKSIYEKVHDHEDKLEKLSQQFGKLYNESVEPYRNRPEQVRYNDKMEGLYKKALAIYEDAMDQYNTFAEITKNPAENRSAYARLGPFKVWLLDTDDENLERDQREEADYEQYAEEAQRYLDSDGPAEFKEEMKKILQEYNDKTSNIVLGRRKAQEVFDKLEEKTKLPDLSIDRLRLADAEGGLPDLSLLRKTYEKAKGMRSWHKTFEEDVRLVHLYAKSAVYAHEKQKDKELEDKAWYRFKDARNKFLGWRTKPTQMKEGVFSVFEKAREWAEKELQKDALDDAEKDVLQQLQALAIIYAELYKYQLETVEQSNKLLNRMFGSTLGNLARRAGWNGASAEEEVHLLDAAPDVSNALFSQHEEATKRLKMFVEAID